jgi:uncharacterized protein (TIGR00730 family)
MKSLCVYCGASFGIHSQYREAAEELGASVARKGICLVYGGGSTGLMGVVADAALAAGGKVIGIITEALFNRELAHRNLTELKVVESMHERKFIMSELSEGYIALPGGVGTADELMEIVTWSKLGIHKKPCGVLNTLGFYEGLMGQLDRMVRDEFYKQDELERIIFSATPEDLLGRMLAVPTIGKGDHVDAKTI